MPVHLLLDNNILINLVSHNIYSPYLLQLDYWVRTHQVILLAPTMLKTEWANHRGDGEKRIESFLATYKDPAKASKIFYDPSEEHHARKLADKKSELYAQIITIEELLNEWAVPIEISPETSQKIFQQRSAQKKPFINPKKDHTNDAILIFTAIQHIKENSLNLLYFVSNNTSEFADGNDNTKLHTDITSTEPAITIKYYTHFRDLATELESVGITNPAKSWTDRISTQPNKFFIDQTEPVLDQIYQYFQKRFSDFSVLPNHLFVQHQPFLTTSNDYIYKHALSISTDNPAVYELFSKVKIVDGELKEGHELLKTTEDENKFKYIIRQLRGNVIYRISYKDKEILNFSVSEVTPICECASCMLNRLDWQKIIDKKYNIENKYTESKLNEAYLQFYSGQLLEAAETLQALSNSIEDKKSLLYYLVCFNLQKIGYVLRGSYDTAPDAAKFVTTLTSIKLDDIYRECDQAKDAEILSYLHNKEFLTKTTSTIHEIVNQLLDSFYGKNTGSNNYLEKLYETFTSFQRFLEKNYIIYPFSDVDKITNLYTHGLFASYGSNNLLNGKLRSFSPEIIVQLINYGSADLMKQLSNRYSIADVDYTEDNYYIPIESLLQNHLSTITEIDKRLDTDPTFSSYFFKTNYEQKFHNIVVLLGILNVPADKFNDSINLIIAHLKEKNLGLDFRLIKHLNFVVHKKRETISLNTLRNLLIHTIEHGTTFADDLLETIYELHGYHKAKLQLNNEQFEVFKKRCLSPSEKEQSPSTWNFIGYVYCILDNEFQQQAIREFATDKLHRNFNAGHFYNGIIMDFIQEHEPFKDQYFQAIQSLLEDGKNPRLFARKEYYTDSRIDNFLNYCFKYEITIPDPITKEIEKLDDYYSWLLNLNDFDYEKFNPDWLNNHFTVYYKNRFKSCEVLRTKILSILKYKINHELERLYLIIYCIDY